MKLVIVDRDGTLCVEREGYLQTPDDWAPLPGIALPVAHQGGAVAHDQLQHDLAALQIVCPR